MKHKKTVVMAVGTALFLVLCLFIWWKTGGRTGRTVIIFQNGTEVYRLSLDTPGTVPVSGNHQELNLVSVSEDGIQMIQANCPDQLCVKQGIVREANRPIVCLPHRVTVEIREEERDE